MNTQNKAMSEDMKTFITVLVLIFIYPVGLLVMWFWTSWKKWVKILITLPVILIPLLAILAIIVLAAINPAEQIEKARRVCINSCDDNYAKNNIELKACYQRCGERGKNIGR